MCVCVAGIPQLNGMRGSRVQTSLLELPLSLNPRGPVLVMSYRRKIRSLSRLVCFCCLGPKRQKLHRFEHHWSLMLDTGQSLAFQEPCRTGTDPWCPACILAHSRLDSGSCSSLLLP